MGHTEANIIASACVVAIFAAVAVIYAFYKPFKRVMQGCQDFGDVLGAGIFVRAIGTIFAGSSVVVRTIAHVDILAVYLMGWALVVLGYYLHFTAWQAAYFQRRNAFALEFAAILTLVGIGAYGFFVWFNPKT